MSDYLTDESEFITEKEVKTFVIKFNCKMCGSEMKFSGMMLTSNPPWFPHSCSNRECGWSATIRSKYPRTVMREVVS